MTAPRCDVDELVSRRPGAPVAAAAPAPAGRIEAVAPYRAAAAGIPPGRAELLDLSANECRVLDVNALAEAVRGAVAWERYPSARALEGTLASRLGIAPERVIVTAGADDALFRLAMGSLEPGRTAITTTPSFEMIPRYIRLAGGNERAVAWLGGPFPIASVLALVDETVSAVFIVSPSNPTGAVITADELREIRAATPGVLLVLDLAYIEFADEDLTATALGLPGVVVTRTFSKAWGLAGLRVGYAAGDPEAIGWLRRAGNPYPVSALSVAIVERAMAAFEPQQRAAVERVRIERRRLAEFLRRRGVGALDSQANFVLARFDSASRARAVFDGLLARGVLVRPFSGLAPQEALRITCPADERDFDRLLDALKDAISATGGNP